MNHYEVHTETLSFFETQVQLMTPARAADKVWSVTSIHKGPKRQQIQTQVSLIMPNDVYDNN